MDTDWSEDIELILNKIRINSLKLAEYHRRNYLNLKDKIKYFRIPVLVLSAINSVFSVGLSAFIAQSVVSVLNCLISLVCGIIVSVELFLQVQSRMDSSNTHSKDFYILTVDIFKTLSLERSNRKCEAHSYMEEKYAALLSVHLRDELESIPINREQTVYSSTYLNKEPVKENITEQGQSLCAIDIDYPPEFGENNSMSSDKQETPLSVSDVLPEIPTRPVSLSVTTRSLNSSRRPSLETVSIAVRDIETGEIVG